MADILEGQKLKKGKDTALEGGKKPCIVKGDSLWSLQGGIGWKEMIRGLQIVRVWRVEGGG